jgi:hypothetical protein
VKTPTARAARVIDMEDTVTIHVPGERETVRLITRRPEPPTERLVFGVIGSRPEPPIGIVGEVRRTIGLKPDETGVLPVHVQAAIRRPSARDRRRHVGSHRAHRPGLIARLFGLGSLGGVR